MFLWLWLADFTSILFSKCWKVKITTQNLFHTTSLVGGAHGRWILIHIPRTSNLLWLQVSKIEVDLFLTPAVVQGTWIQKCLCQTVGNFAFFPFWEISRFGKNENNWTRLKREFWLNLQCSDFVVWPKERNWILACLYIRLLIDSCGKER